MCSFSPQITLISLIFRQIFADYTDGFPSESPIRMASRSRSRLSNL